jgi:integrase
MKLKEWAETCISVYKPNLIRGTKYYSAYTNRLKNCVLKYLGEMELESILPIDCQRCVNQQIGNSAYQINQTVQIMSFLFEKAIDNNIISRNPARGVAKPKGTKTTRRSLTKTERDAFLEALKDPANLPFAFMYYCGLRPSEARDIKESDLIEVAGVPALHVRGTKTKNAIRDIPLPNQLSTLIQNSLKSPNRASGGYICHISEKTLKRRWKPLKRAMGNAPDLVPYCFRHTFCTDLQKKGIDVRVAQKLMGHSKIDLTATIYSHLDEDLFTVTFEQLNA